MDRRTLDSAAASRLEGVRDKIKYLLFNRCSTPEISPAMNKQKSQSSLVINYSHINLIA